MLELNKIYNQDCIIGMQNIPDKSIDCIITDLPYGTTACKWDSVIPFELLWGQYKRVIKRNGAIVLFCSQPFTSALIMSNVSWFKYTYSWVKTKAGNFQLAKKNPLKIHEDIAVFYKNFPTYHNLFLSSCHINTGRTNKGGKLGHVKSTLNYKEYVQEQKGYNKSVLFFSNPSGAGHLHPTQKPVALIEHLIKTYTNEDETILDSCMGSGTTAIAAINTKRNFIGFELNSDFYELATKRIENRLSEPRLF